MYILLKQGSVSWLYFSLVLVNWHWVRNADSGSLIYFLSFRTCSQPPCYPLPCPCTFFSRAVPRYLLSSNFVRSAGYHAGSWENAAEWWRCFSPISAVPSLRSPGLWSSRKPEAKTRLGKRPPFPLDFMHFSNMFYKLWSFWEG